MFKKLLLAGLFSLSIVPMFPANAAYTSWIVVEMKAVLFKVDCTWRRADLYPNGLTKSVQYKKTSGWFSCPSP